MTAAADVTQAAVVSQLGIAGVGRVPVAAVGGQARADCAGSSSSPSRWCSAGPGSPRRRRRSSAQRLVGAVGHVGRFASMVCFAAVRQSTARAAGLQVRLRQAVAGVTLHGCPHTSRCPAARSLHRVRVPTASTLGSIPVGRHLVSGHHRCAGNGHVDHGGPLRRHRQWWIQRLRPSTDLEIVALAGILGMLMAVTRRPRGLLPAALGGLRTVNRIRRRPGSHRHRRTHLPGHRPRGDPADRRAMGRRDGAVDGELAVRRRLPMGMLQRGRSPRLPTGGPAGVRRGDGRHQPVSPTRGDRGRRRRAGHRADRRRSGRTRSAGRGVDLPVDFGRRRHPSSGGSFSPPDASRRAVMRHPKDTRPPRQVEVLTVTPHPQAISVASTANEIFT